MNAPLGTFNAIAIRDTEASEFCRLRSQMLDSFADMEQTLTAYVLESTQKGFCPTAPLSQKVDAAKKVPAGPRRSKKLKSEADAELQKLAAILNHRASIVHSKMMLALIDGDKSVAIFKNSKNVGTLNFEASVLNLKEFRDFNKHLEALSKSLSIALNAQNVGPTLKE